jgi:hypothetical protein
MDDYVDIAQRIIVPFLKNSADDGRAAFVVGGVLLRLHAAGAIGFPKQLID